MTFRSSTSAYRKSTASVDPSVPRPPREKAASVDTNKFKQEITIPGTLVGLLLARRVTGDVSSPGVLRQIERLAGVRVVKISKGGTDGDDHDKHDEATDMNGDGIEREHPEIEIETEEEEEEFEDAQEGGDDSAAAIVGPDDLEEEEDETTLDEEDQDEDGTHGGDEHEAFHSVGGEGEDEEGENADVGVPPAGEIDVGIPSSGVESSIAVTAESTGPSSGLQITPPAEGGTVSKPKATFDPSEPVVFEVTGYKEQDVQEAISSLKSIVDGERISKVLLKLTTYAQSVGRYKDTVRYVKSIYY